MCAFCNTIYKFLNIEQGITKYLPDDENFDDAHLSITKDEDGKYKLEVYFPEMSESEDKYNEIEIFFCPLCGRRLE